METSLKKLTGWWFQPLWKILVKLGIFPNFGENKKYSKPPPSWYLVKISHISEFHVLMYIFGKIIWHSFWPQGFASRWNFPNPFMASSLALEQRVVVISRLNAGHATPRGGWCFSPVKGLFYRGKHRYRPVKRTFFGWKTNNGRDLLADVVDRMFLL